jgi:Fur family ferric uptake transcriptional regulator
MNRRSTPTKEAVFNLLKESGTALSHDAIEAEIKIDINRATIYRVLNRFCEDGVVHKIVAEDGKQYFAVCTNCDSKKHRDHHFHFRCRRCQKIECLQESVQFSAPKGYIVENMNCILTGICDDCSS